MKIEYSSDRNILELADLAGSIGTMKEGFNIVLTECCSNVKGN